MMRYAEQDPKNPNRLLNYLGEDVTIVSRMHYLRKLFRNSPDSTGVLKHVKIASEGNCIYITKDDAFILPPGRTFLEIIEEDLLNKKPSIESSKNPEPNTSDAISIIQSSLTFFSANSNVPGEVNELNDTVETDFMEIMGAYQWSP